MKKIKLTEEESCFLVDVLSDKIVMLEKCLQRGLETNSRDDVLISLTNKKRMTACLISKLYE